MAGQLPTGQAMTAYLIHMLRSRIINGLTKQQYDHEWRLAEASLQSDANWQLQQSFVTDSQSTLRTTTEDQAPQFNAPPLINVQRPSLSFAGPGPGPLDNQSSVGASRLSAQEHPWPPSTQSDLCAPFSQTAGNQYNSDEAQAHDVHGAVVNVEHPVDPNPYVHDDSAQRQEAAAQSHAQQSSQIDDQEHRECPFCRRLHDKRNLARHACSHYAMYKCFMCEKKYNREDLLARHHESHDSCTDPNCYQILEARMIDEQWRTMAAAQHKSGRLPDKGVKRARGVLDVAQMDQEHKLFREFVCQCEADDIAVAVLKRTLREPRYRNEWHQVLDSWGQTLHGVSPLATLSHEQAQSCLDILQSTTPTKGVLDQLFRTARFHGEGEQQDAGRRRRKRRTSQSQAHSPTTASAQLSMDSPEDTSPPRLSVPFTDIVPGPRSLPSMEHATRGPVGLMGSSSEGQGTRPNVLQRQAAAATSPFNTLPMLGHTDDLAFSGTSPNQNPEPLGEATRERHRFDQDPYFAIPPDYWASFDQPRM